MRIDIENFGPINSMTFDFDKDLHLIFGENAIGKSYGAYCIYCLLKNFKDINYRPNNHFYYRYSDDEGELALFSKEIFNLIKTSNKNEFINIDDKIEAFIVKQLSSNIIPGVTNSFQNTFSSLSNLKNRYSNENYKLSFHLDNKSIHIGSDSAGKPVISNINIGSSVEGILKDTKTTKYSIYVNQKKRFGVANEKNFNYEFTKLVLDEIGDIIRKLKNNVKEIYFLPASRSGLYQALNAFTPIMAELTQNRFFIQNKNIELPSLPEPLSDYFIDLSTLKTSHLNKEFDAIIEILENEILNGKVEYDDDAKKIIYVPKGLDLRLDLSEASSMVSELSPIVIFLRHIINNKFQNPEFSSPYTYYPFEFYRDSFKEKSKKTSVLFIEEPEAHLHPEVQVKIMSVFTKLINLGIKIIMTSHSNYMLNKLNNLILDKEISDSKISAYHLIRSNLGCVVNKNMSISSEGILDCNFTNITRKLYDERMDILDKDE